MKRLVASFLACVAMSVASAIGAPIKRADISVNPAWVFHVDCDALRQTYLGKYLLYQMDKPEMNSNMLAFESMFSFDLRTQLHGFTVYSDGPASKESVTIIYADLDPPRVIKVMKAADAAEVVTNRQHVLYSWLDKKKNPDDPDGARNYAAIQNGRLIVGKDKRRVSAALDVIHGTASNLSSTKAFPELTPATDGTFVQASARQMDFPGSDPNAALLKMSKSGKFRANETNEQLSAVLTLEAEDELAARQMSIVTQGMVALLGLQKNNPKTARLASGLSVKQDGATLTVTFSPSSPDLIAAIKEYSAQSEKQQAGDK